MDKNGNPPTTIKKQRKQWAEHFRELLNRPTPDSPPDIPLAEIELPVSCDKPSEAEIKQTIMTLRSGKTAGPDEIPAEAIKAGIETAVNMLYSLFSKIWEKKEVPAQWKEGIIIKLPKETLGAAANIEGSCSCQRQARFSGGFYWRRWKRLSTPSSKTSRQASYGTDLVPTRSPECASSWNSNWSETPPLHKLHRLSEGLRQCRQRDNVEATETLWCPREDNLPHPVHLSEHELQDCPRRPAVWKFRGEDWSSAWVLAFTLPLPSCHRLDHEDHYNR